MEESDFSAFVDRYRELPDVEILQLSERKSQLLPMARLALEQEVTRRNGRIAALMQLQSEDRKTDLERETQLLEVQRIKKSRRFRWYLIVFVPLLVILFIRDPIIVFKAIAPRVTIAAVVFALWWLGIHVWRRSLAKKTENAPRDA